MTRSRRLETFSRHAMTRRDLARTVAGLGVSLVAVPFLGRSARAAGTASLFTWAGYDDPGLHQPYIRKHGEPPAISIFADQEEAFQKLQAGFDPDVTHPCTDQVERWKAAGLVKPIDVSRLSNWDDLWPELKSIEGTVIDGERYFVPMDWGNWSIAYRTDLVDEDYLKEPSWRIMFDERYEGRLAGVNTTEAVNVAAVVLGYPDPFDLDDEQIAEIRELLIYQRGLLRAYWSSPTELVQMMASGEIVAAHCWNDAFAQMKAAGLPVAYMTPKEGIFTWVCGLALNPAGAGDEQAAYDIIDSMISPETGEFEITTYGFGHSNRKSFDRVAPEILADLGLDSVSTALSQGWFNVPFPPETLIKLNRMLAEIEAGVGQ